jgi:hypothetical protein
MNPRKEWFSPIGPFDVYLTSPKIENSRFFMIIESGKTLKRELSQFLFRKVV